jgi:predicted nucleic acid-binding protein
MSAVFADSFYFLALANPRDAAHARCLQTSTESNRAVVTTSWVLTEVGDALCRGSDRTVFMKLLENIGADGATTVVPFDNAIFERAVALFAARSDKEWSLTDCTSFIVMHEHGLSDALTADHHFRQAGFNPLLAD